MAKEYPDITYNQIRYTCAAGHPTPQKRPGRGLSLSDEETANIMEWIRGSFERRQMSYVEIVEQLDLRCSPHTLRLALDRAGMTYHPAAVKPLPPLDLGTHQE